MQYVIYRNRKMFLVCSIIPSLLLFFPLFTNGEDFTYLINLGEFVTFLIIGSAIIPFSSLLTLIAQDDIYKKDYLEAMRALPFLISPLFTVVGFFLMIVNMGNGFYPTITFYLLIVSLLTSNIFTFYKVFFKKDPIKQAT